MHQQINPLCPFLAPDNCLAQEYPRSRSAFLVSAILIREVNYILNDRASPKKSWRQRLTGSEGKKMRCTDELCLDHEEITALLTILDLSIKELESGKPASLEELRWLFEFNRDFVIRNHNQKEESIIFPALVSAGFPEEMINPLIEEHELMRSKAKTLRGIIEDYGDGTPGARARLAEAGRRYIDLLKEHIEFEEKAVYPSAEEVLSDELDERLEKKLVIFGEMRVGAERLFSLQEMLDSLKEIYGLEM